jgi:hypothetical protein
MSTDIYDFDDAQVIKCESSVSSVTHDSIHHRETLKHASCSLALQGCQALHEDSRKSFCFCNEVLDLSELLRSDVESEGYADELDSLCTTVTECKTQQCCTTSAGVNPCFDLSAALSYQEPQQPKFWRENITLLNSICDASFPAKALLELSASDFDRVNQSAPNYFSNDTNKSSLDVATPVDIILSEFEVVNKSEM